MAETEAEEGGAGEGAAAPAKSKLKLIIIAAAALAVIGGGAGGYVLFMKKPAKEAHAEAPPPPKPVFLEVPEMMVNLAGNAGERVQYLKVKVVLEVKDDKVVEQIKPTMPRVTDIFQTYLRELRANDLNGSAGLFRLKEELIRRVNVAVAPTQVNTVLFKEIVIQ